MPALARRSSPGRSPTASRFRPRTGGAGFTLTSREVAGGNRLNDVTKCSLVGDPSWPLKPIDRADYAPLGVTDAQFARLQKVFATGVCDWSKPGVGQQPTIAWVKYGKDRGGVIYGGTPMGPAPRSVSR